MSHTRKMSALAVGLSLFVVLGVGCNFPGKSFIKRLLGRPDAPAVTTKTFTDELHGLTFVYPIAWGDPIPREQGTHKVYDFKNGTMVRVGTNLDASTNKVRSFQETVAAALLAPDSKRRDMLLDGREAVEVTSAGNAKVYAQHAMAGQLLEIDKGKDVTEEDFFTLLNGIHTTESSAPPEHPQPFITGVTPSSVKVGGKVEVQGKAFNGFEGDLVVWIENASGTRGYIKAAKGSTEKRLFFTLANKYCTTDVSYSGNACPSNLTITPGTYKLVAEPWGVKSNAATLTVTK